MTQTTKKEEARYKAKTDLFWLGTEILGYDFQADVHLPICEFFVKKNPEKPLWDQDQTKKRLLLDPRSHFKTTVDVTDIVQWILNFPNEVRILLMTGSLDLGKLMLGEVKKHFQHNQKMRALFPELCYSPNVKLTGTQFISPPRQSAVTGGKEPTLFISSVDSTRASLHCDVGKFDDVVNETNSTSPDLLANVKREVDLTLPLIDPWGYTDFIGTRYDYSDYYGHIWDTYGFMGHEIPFGVAGTSKDGRWKVHARRCWECKHREDVKCINALEEHELLFPERIFRERLIGFTPIWLGDMLKTDPYIFNCQYNNDPSPAEGKTFDEQTIYTHTLPRTQIPPHGTVFQLWDFGGWKQKKYNDFSVGATMFITPQGKWWVLDLRVGRFNPYELVQHIVDFYLKWRPVRVGIEEANGAPLIGPGLQLFCQQNGINLPLDWIKVKNNRDAKVQRIASLHTLLKEDNLFFAAGLPHFEDLLKQFTRFPKYSHDDIPDAIALVIENYKSAVNIVPQNDSPFFHVPIMDTLTVEGSEILGSGLVG